MCTSCVDNGLLAPPNEVNEANGDAVVDDVVVLGAPKLKLANGEGLVAFSVGLASSVITLGAPKLNDEKGDGWEVF